MSKKTKAIPENLLPAITVGTEHKLQFLDAAVRKISFLHKARGIAADNPAIDVLAVGFTRLFRVDDQIDESGDVVLSDDDFFYFDYEIEIKPSEGSLYSQLLTAAFHGKEMPVSEFSPSMLIKSWVTLVIEDRRFLIAVRPLADTSAIDKVQ